ncbi:MAG: AAA family ATPase [Bacteroidales bacterium]|nr:AAA family ATPase [Bacteroidales bacterium]
MSNFDYLYTVSNRRVSQIDLSYKRPIYFQINWDNRLIGIKGPKGVGKSTLILQHIKESFSDLGKILYVSLDNLWFASNSLIDLVEYHYTHGGTHIFLDEIHKYKHWQDAVKNIYDDYPDLHVVYTGSSILKLKAGDGDLSRRVRSYEMTGLSFREYLIFEGKLEYQVLSLEDILNNHVTIAADIVSRVKILPAFESYLKEGFYPFYKEEGDGYLSRVQEVITQTIDMDIPAVEEVEYGTLQKLKKLMMILSVQLPFIPKMNELYQELETNREQGLKLLSLLEDAKLISMLKTPVKALKHLSAPDKLYLDNPNMMYALSEKADIGTVRETFFNNQLSVNNKVSLPAKGDFKVDDRYLFEVGGRKKSFEQIKDEPDSFLAVDSVETGNGNRIPLWLFGFLS